MAKLLTIFLFTLLSFTSLLAAPFDVIYSEKTGGAGGFSFIDPLVDEMAQHAGFIYSDRENRALVIHEFDADSLVRIRLSGSPQKTIHYYNSERDTLYIYAILNQRDQMPKIALIAVHASGISMDVVASNCYFGYGNLDAIEYQDIRFMFGYDGQPEGVWFDASLRYRETVPGYGESTETFATTILYSLDLQDELVQDNQSSLHVGNLYGDETIEFFGFTNYSYGFDFRESGDESAVGELRLTTVVIKDSADFRLVEQTTPQGNTRSVLVGDFDPALEYDEVIFAGKAEDFEGTYAEMTPHIACYNFAEGTTTQLWSLEDSALNLDHIYRDKDVIVGRSAPDRVVFLDYRRGELIDSIHLGRELTAVTFFETYSSPSTLNLAGLVNDTVFVYRFDITTAQTQAAGSDELVPETFTLHQNNPNPFNGETRLSFETEENQYLTLKVYNILGQEVTTLAEGIFSPGTYFAYWGGANVEGIPQSSGVYFAKLQADNASQIIKLIFLK